MTEKAASTDFRRILGESRELLQDFVIKNRSILDQLPILEPGQADFSDSQSDPLDPTPAGGDESLLSPLPDLGKSLLHLQGQFLRFWDSVLENSQKVDSLQRDVAQHQGELARLSEQLMLLSRSRAETAEQVGTLSEQLETVRAQNQDSFDRAAALETQKAEWEATQSSLEDQVAQSHLEIVHLGETIERLEREKAELLESQTRLEQESAAGREETARLNGLLETLVGEKEGLQEECRRLTETLGTTQEGTVSLIHFQRIQQALEGAVAERDALEHQGRGQIEQTLQLEEELRSERSRIDLIENEKAALEQSSREARERIAFLEAEIHRLEGNLKPQSETEDSRAVPQPPWEESFERLATPEEGWNPPSHDPLAGEDFFSAPPEQYEPERLGEPEPTEASMFASDPDKIDSVALSTTQEDEGDVPLPMTSADLQLLDDLSQQEAAPKGEEVAIEEAGMVGVEARVPLGEEEISLSQPILSDQALPEPPREADPDATRILSLEVPPPAAETPESHPKAVRAADFPYPEITGAGMENFHGKKVLLVGGDERFRGDYDHLFALAQADLVYFPGIVHLEKNGMKRHVRENDVVVVFGAAVDEAGVFRLRNITSDYGRLLLEHRSSGLVSLYHQLKSLNQEI